MNNDKPNEWLSAKEAAELLNVSDVTIYKRYSANEEVCKVINGTKKFNFNALQRLSSDYKNKSESDTNYEDGEKNIKNELNGDIAQNYQYSAYSELFDKYGELVKFYENRVSDLEHELTNLKQQVCEKDRQICEFAMKFADIASREQELTERALLNTDKSLVTANNAQTLQLISETQKNEQEETEQNKPLKYTIKDRIINFFKKNKSQ